MVNLRDLFSLDSLEFNFEGVLITLSGYQINTGIIYLVYPFFKYRVADFVFAVLFSSCDSPSKLTWTKSRVTSSV